MDHVGALFGHARAFVFPVEMIMNDDLTQSVAATYFVPAPLLLQIEDAMSILNASNICAILPMMMTTATMRAVLALFDCRCRDDEVA